MNLNFRVSDATLQHLDMSLRNVLEKQCPAAKSILIVAGVLPSHIDPDFIAAAQDFQQRLSQPKPHL